MKMILAAAAAPDGMAWPDEWAEWFTFHQIDQGREDDILHFSITALLERIL